MAILDSYVFSDCSNLKSVSLEECTALTTIGESAFNSNYSISQLSDFDFSQLTALKDIGESAFSNSALAGDIAFASGITQLGRNAFLVVVISLASISVKAHSSQLYLRERLVLVKILKR